MFRRLDKFNGPIFGGGEQRINGGGGLIFGMLIGLHIWGERINGILQYFTIILGGPSQH